MDFWTLFYGLVLAHFIADYMQLAALVAWTKRDRRGLYVHTGAYTILTALVLVCYGRYWLAGLIILAVTHWLYDTFKYAVGRRATGNFLWWFLLDQAMHGATILAVALVLAGATQSPATAFIGRHYLPFVIFTALIGAAFGGSILVFEAGRTFAPQNDGRVVGWRVRLPGILERTTAGLLLFTGWLAWLAPLPFAYSVWRLASGWKTSERRRRAVDLAAGIAGFLMAAALFYAGTLKK
jgi:hypothetical protein